jgi:hypothetical protein
MKKKNEVSKTQGLSQEHCIDLPGEPVRCWVGGNAGRLKVMLRKHRDVIFDINLGNGKVYSVESTESNFYNVRDKKLVYAKQRDKLMFMDGQKIHIWIGRGFSGALVLRSDGNIISQIIPSELDSKKYGGEAKEKPAPIIVALKGPAKTLDALSANLSENLWVKQSVIFPLPGGVMSADLQKLDYPVVCVMKGTVKGMPADLIEYFKKGGGSSGIADIDPNQVATRNWIWGQIVGTGAYIKDNWEWLRASMDEKTSKGFQLVKAKVHYVRGRVTFYFSGYSNFNTAFGRGGFSPSNDKIVTIFSGIGKTESAFGAVVKGIAGSFKGNALASFIFGSATAIAEWKSDIQKDGYDLTAGLIMAAVKAIIVAFIVTMVVGAIVWFVMFAVGGALSVIAVGVITIAVGVGANYLVEAADKSSGRALSGNNENGEGIASVLAPLMRDAGHLVEKNWNYLMNKMAGDYKEMSFEKP